MAELALRKYLERYAEPEAAWGRELHTQYASAVVVPLQREDETFLDNLTPALSNAPGRVLVIAVVNATDEASTATHEVNARLLRVLTDRLGQRQELPPLDRSPASALLGRPGPFDLLVIDRASPGKRLPRGEGVGLARRLGMDVALQLHQLDGVTCPWLATTDADAQPAADYFHAMAAVPPLTPQGFRRVGLTLPFWHVPSGDAAVDEATAHYELSLRYYTLGLAAAGSPYAYESMGSAIAVQVAAYAEVRGFPRRNAGEDFYLLDKLAKLGALHRPACDPIRLRSRTSDRVPFGTGRKVGELVASGAGLSTYHPRVFELLGLTLTALRQAVRARDSEVLTTQLKSHLDWGTVGAVSSALEELQALEALQGTFDASPDARVRDRRLVTWFDALRTLRFIHLVEARAGLARLPLFEALARAPFCPFAFTGGSPSAASFAHPPEAARSAINALRTAASDAERALPPDIGAEIAISLPVNSP